MYLKALDMVGFKSFADKTHLEFEPGITAIVGPNGCGKSNIADSLRWVLGEQSARALRGTRMEDCIFNGTDSRKPLGLAECSVTFADCEGVLNTEFNEVTITRRVFRSGEGEYLLNKTPCRLKDIHRLFMDTGIGTSSYSMLEQGRIDAILSARPEDRRTIFEEASGITKYKSDKKEAIRKLEHTEANLLRLSDVIREVKRQIGSLQRQAGKARRYQELQTELRKLDLYVTRQRLGTSGQEITDIESRLANLTGQQDALQREVKAIEQESSQKREALMEIERRVGALLEAGVQARSRLAHTREMITLNSQRIAEYRTLTDRDAHEIEQTGRQLEEQRTVLAGQAEQLTRVRTERESADRDLRAATARYDQHRDQVDKLRTRLQHLRDESVEQESLASRLQNQLTEMEARERSTIIRRERRAAEKAQLATVVEDFNRRQSTIGEELGTLRQRVAADEAQMVALEEARAATLEELEAMRQRNADLERKTAAVQARLDVFAEHDSKDEGFPEGARRLLRRGADAGEDDGQVLGTLAAAIECEPPYRLALETALRAWMDAVLVRDPAVGRELAEWLCNGAHGSARLLALSPDRAAPESNLKGDRLMDHVSCQDALRPTLEHLIGRVLVADTVGAIPKTVAAGVAYVTRDGVLVDARGLVEVWKQESDSNPLTRRRFIAEAQESAAQLETSLAAGRAQSSALAARAEEQARAIQGQRAGRDESRRAAAQKEGESQIVGREAKEAAQRLETVTFELDELARQDQSGHQERQSIATRLQETQDKRRGLSEEIVTQAQSLRALEDAQSALQSDVTDRRVRLEGLNQQASHLVAQHESTASRIRDLESALAGRTRGVETYAQSIHSLGETVAKAEGQIASMEADVVSNRRSTEALQVQREEQAADIRRTEDLLGNKRAILDELRETRGETEITLTESRMRRQNQIDRVSAEYGLTLDQLVAEPEPEWPEGAAPVLDTLDTEVAELRTKLDAMGPVNLVAIDEYKELEERHAFLTAQEDDLVKAKQQLMDMIRKINKTTSEMFSSTFEQVNTNFQNTFQKLFNGGSAKLVLVNEEDVLECGIEIIARPPGKRLQNVSLLSGGERTMTAVALLFAIYMIKPSPFCMLDELDAALDEANIGRFVAILQSFLGQSQFVIVTHNRQTIAAADILYGVTMPEKGISRIVSMRFHHRGESPPAGTAPLPDRNTPASVATTPPEAPVAPTA